MLKRPETIVLWRHWFGRSLRPGKPSNSPRGAEDATMVRRAPFPLSSLPASIENSMKLLCVCNDGNPYGTITTRIQAMVPKYSSDRIQDALSAEAGQFVLIVPIISILGRLPLVPAGQTGTIPHSMHSRQPAMARHASSLVSVTRLMSLELEGSGRLLFHVNLWAMVLSSDQAVLCQ